ncbi:hypothetical protein N658DRAFT_165947 [Parathielavia hyrcaniae]|uniref:Uncharacterized protein n=1 Tax=Parathielavia hyrcaniae TaxID=113614 RepID=A0AAN6T0G2_9PEZI|nr:hypothetical protein N658DRAFT_165947 [Parathielavia hyrcaniae]
MLFYIFPVHAPEGVLKLLIWAALVTSWFVYNASTHSPVAPSGFSTNQLLSQRFTKNSSDNLRLRSHFQHTQPQPNTTITPAIFSDS